MSLRVANAGEISTAKGLFRMRCARRITALVNVGSVGFRYLGDDFAVLMRLMVGKCLPERLWNMAVA